MQEISDQLRKGQSKAAPRCEFREIPVSLIVDEQLYDGQDENLSEKIAASVKIRGVEVPIVVTLQGDKFALVTGRQRVSACRQSGITHVRALVYEELTEEECIAIQLIENCVRTNPKVLWEAKIYYQYLMISMEVDSVQSAIGKLIQYRVKDERCTATEVSSVNTLLILSGGKSAQSIENRIRLLNLPPYMQEAIRRNKIKPSVGCLLANNLKNPNIKTIFEQAVEGKSSKADVLQILKGNRPISECSQAFEKFRVAFERNMGALTSDDVASFLAYMRRTCERLEQKSQKDIVASSDKKNG